MRSRTSRPTGNPAGSLKDTGVTEMSTLTSEIASPPGSVDPNHRESRSTVGLRPRAHHGIQCAVILLTGSCVSLLAFADASQFSYHAITPTLTDQTVILTGHDLTIDQVIAVARGGARVRLSAEAKQRETDNYGLLLEAQAEGVPIYRFNRGAGAGREIVTLRGDPMSAKNRSIIAERELAKFRRGAAEGLGPELADEDIVRAMMVVRANGLTYTMASPAVMQMLLDLLNNQIAPVVQSRGTLGEGDLAQIGNVEGTMVGQGEAYYHGVRMPAAQALDKAVLKPIEPFGADDDALDVTNAYATGQAALLVADAARALDWADLIYAMDLNGLNSSITPLSKPVQDARPYKPLNTDAARILDMIKGSYLFDDDPKRIIQDPESMRASSIRQGSAWKAWAALRDTVAIQINSSDNNPAVQVGLSPQDSAELATSHFMRFFVKGGKYSHGQHGFIVSNANWDPYPLANDVEGFMTALSNLDVAVMLRIERFSSTFFTVVRPSDFLNAEQLAAATRYFIGYTPVDIFQDIQSLSIPIAPQGQAIEMTVEDLQAQTQLKLTHARAMVEDTFLLLGHDLGNAAFWMDIRQLQNPKRSFGKAPTDAWRAFRKEVPFQQEPAQRPDRTLGAIVSGFLKANPASMFYPSGMTQF
jgi:histidine ammonia-lyase